MSKNVNALNSVEVLSEGKAQYRLIILTGENKGQSFVLSGKRIVIGRSDKSDIRINDSKVSREHAEITKVGKSWVITDLGSQNGIVLNDKKVIQKEISDGDRLIVGQVVFKFSKTDLIENLKDEKDIKEIKSITGDSKRMGLIPIAMILLLGVFFLMDDEKKEENQNIKETTPIIQNFNDPQLINQELTRSQNEIKNKEKLTIYFQRGLRELREKNYYRAIHEFHLALNFSPGDSQAEYYIRKAKEELDREIAGYTAKAVRDEESLKFKSAMISYCAIIRLLYNVPEDKRHINAIRQINELEQKLGLKDGETDCLKKQHTSQ
jgi:pSer/pThr/pTyr-binding forkhead associated (FHA) protein